MSKRIQTVAIANPSHWSEQSQRSVCASWTKEYQDIRYCCTRCNAEAIFTAQDQQYTYEVKKAPIYQRRCLCNACWKQSHEIQQKLDAYAKTWHQEKNKLRTNSDFLKSWLELLVAQRQYVGYKIDTAKINMLRGLLTLIKDSKK